MDFIDILIYVSYGLVGIALVLAIILPLISAFSNPQSLVRGAIGVIALAVVFGVAFAISGDEVTEVYARFNVGPELSKFVGATLTMMYLLIVITLLGVFFTEFKKVFSR